LPVLAEVLRHLARERIPLADLSAVLEAIALAPAPTGGFTARDVPARETTLVHGATHGPGPFNAKPAAEHAITPIPPAVGNAVFNATGVRLTSLPISAEKVHEGMGREK